ETRMALLCALAGGAVAAAPVSPELIPAETWQAYWWMALPAAFWGVAIAVFTQHARASYRNNRVVPLCGLAVFNLGTAVTWHAGRNTLAENLSGVGFLVFALGPWQGNFIRRCAGLGTLAYGIYLSHLLFIKICEAVVAKF